MTVGQMVVGQSDELVWQLLAGRLDCVEIQPSKYGISAQP